MRKLILPVLVAGILPLSGCAYGLGGPGVLGDVLGGVLGGNGAYGQGGPDFQTAAVDACGAEASRYGQVSINNVQRSGSRTMRVFGTISSNYQRRSFACSFREDGRITDFDIG